MYVALQLDGVQEQAQDHYEPLEWANLRSTNSSGADTSQHTNLCMIDNLEWANVHTQT